MPLKFVPLRLDFGPTYEARIREIANTYHDALEGGVVQVVEVIYNAVQKHLLELENFIADNDTDPRIVLFQKSARRLRKLLQDKLMHERSAQRIRSGASPREKGSPSASWERDDNSLTYEQGEVGVGAGLEGEDMALINAARDEYGSKPGIIMGGRSIPLPSTLKTQRIRETKMKQGSLYGWESHINSGKSPAQMHRNPPEKYLELGDTFSFQVVVNREEYHQVMNRQRIQKIVENRKQKESMKNECMQERQKNPLRGSVGRPRLDVGPYVEPSYKDKVMYRETRKGEWLSGESFNTL
jgi:hypothetical protein